jgi:hypothetical protein
MSAFPNSLKGIVCADVGSFLMNTGVFRLFWEEPRGLQASHFPPSKLRELEFLSGAPDSQAGGEGCAMDESIDAVRKSGDFGNRPLVVLTSTVPFSPPAGDGGKEMREFNDLWVHKYQARLATLSTRGRQIVVDGGHSAIQFENPEAVISAIHKVFTLVAPN